jgi:hypothetical protein
MRGAPWALLAVVHTASAICLAGEPNDAKLETLRAELAQQDARLAKLEKAREAPRPTSPPEVRVSGYVQLDWTLHHQASQNEVDYASDLPLNQDRFTLRRGHLRVDAQKGLIGAHLEVDANTVTGAQLRPIAAAVDVSWPTTARDDNLRLRAALGLMKIPFGFEVPEGDQVRPYLERASVLRALFPGQYDLGARFEAGYRFFTLSVALMNGHPLGDRVFPALAPTRERELLGRLSTAAPIGDWVRIELGVSADGGQGFHRGTPTTKDQLVWRDDNGDGIVQATEIQVIAGSAATPSQVYSRFALGADARVEVRFRAGAELTLRAEVVRAQNMDRGLEPSDPVGAGHDQRELGWYLGATQEITRFALVGVRYDRYNPDEDAAEQRSLALVTTDRSYATLALLAMLRYDTARLTFEYDKNWNALGRTPSGAPTTLKNDSFTLRGQVTF